MLLHVHVHDKYRKQLSFLSSYPNVQINIKICPFFMQIDEVKMNFMEQVAVFLHHTYSTSKYRKKNVALKYTNGCFIEKL